VWWVVDPSLSLQTRSRHCRLVVCVVDRVAGWLAGRLVFPSTEKRPIGFWFPDVGKFTKREGDRNPNKITRCCHFIIYSFCFIFVFYKPKNRQYKTWWWTQQHQQHVPVLDVVVVVVINNIVSIWYH
jgi:hypothetical protein